jgi:hypothetical protein
MDTLFDVEAPKYYQTHSSYAKKNAGKLWRASHGIWGLVAAWNHCTRPYVPMTEKMHHKANLYARAIKGRMHRMGFVYGIHYKELSNGSLWPMKDLNQ